MWTVGTPVTLGPSSFFIIHRPAVNFQSINYYPHPTSYNELTKHFYLARRQYPPPHRKLSRPQALTLRLLQVGAYPNPALLHKIHPEIQPTNTCCLCADIANLEHMLWRCPALRCGEVITPSKWEAAITSSGLEQQLWAVQRARDAAERLSLSVPTWERPATC
uniref:Metabotropic glutamate receptor 1 n=1 Tax=Rhipicephalus appendiculatus TaxID=34631 RepID=A0A131YZ65_RHIAP